jgi:hypothetical protein
VFGLLRRFIFNYVFSTPGLGEAAGDVQVGVMQAEEDDREEAARQGRDASEREQVGEELGP